MQYFRICVLIRLLNTAKYCLLISVMTGSGEQTAAIFCPKPTQKLSVTVHLTLTICSADAFLRLWASLRAFLLSPLGAGLQSFAAASHLVLDEPTCWGLRSQPNSLQSLCR